MNKVLITQEIRSTALTVPCVSLRRIKTSSSFPFYFIHVCLKTSTPSLVSHQVLPHRKSVHILALACGFSAYPSVTYSLHHDTSNSVGVSVRSWSSVLEVTVALVAALPWDTDGSTTVRNTISELINGAGLMSAGETHVIVLTIDCDVLLVAALELL